MIAIIAVLCLLIGAVTAFYLIDYGIRAGAALRNPAPIQAGEPFPQVAYGPQPQQKQRDKQVFNNAAYVHMRQNGRATVYRPGR